MSVDRVVGELLDDPAVASNIAAYRELPAREGAYAPLPDDLDPRLLSALRTRGMDRLYTHQAEAVSSVRSDRHTVVVTPTASGKTLCYNLPVLQSILRDDTARALYLFPTKALSQDQVSELNGLVDVLGADIRTYTYDGDTPQNARKALRSAGHIVVTNPDMLHAGILPLHTRWVRLFENLRYVVIDEMHTYRGVFGSHVANVVRRLRRICRFYGSDPVFILCSATIANPQELAERLIGDAVQVVDNNGAPAGKKHILIYNPPVVNRQLGLRASARTAATSLAGRLVNNDVQTIVFTRSRMGVEVMLGYLRDAVARVRRDSVRGYRSGYLPLQRREIERGLRDGTVRAVVATNALELGIDIGALDACVLTGFPGTITSAWQQIGRAGRRADESLAILVANSSALDQFVVSNVEYLFETSPESGLVDPDNLIILVGHIKCAAFELPFDDGETFGGVDTTGEILRFLEGNEFLHQVDGVWHWMSDSFPAQEISLRSAAADNVVIIDEGPPARVIGEVDRVSAPTLVHDEAIYIHEGRQYEVQRLDLDARKAYVRGVEVDYYTDAEQAVNVRVLDVFESGEGRAHGEVEITYLPTIFKKIKLHTHENVGWGRIHLPEDPFHTNAYWLWLNGEGLPQREVESGLTGLAHVLGQVAPLYLMCDPSDIGVRAEVKAPLTGSPTIFLYESVPGGVGFSRRMFRLHQRLLIDSARMIGGCGCDAGCPSCVGPQYDPGANAKMCTLHLIALFLDRVGLAPVGEAT